MGESGRRKHDAEATKSALLAAGADLFAERGFEQTTVRDVAARAEVNQALLFRYFGSKQELFAEVLNRNSKSLLTEHSVEELPARLLESMLSAEYNGDDHPMVALLRSFSDERAAQVLRDELGGSYAERLAELTDAADAELRADLVLAWFFGLAMLRSVLRKRPLAEADPEVVSGHVTRAISLLLERTEPAGEQSG